MIYISVTNLKGIDEKLGDLLTKKGFYAVRDLAEHEGAPMDFWKIENAAGMESGAMQAILEKARDLRSKLVELNAMVKGGSFIFLEYDYPDDEEFDWDDGFGFRVEDSWTYGRKPHEREYVFGTYKEPEDLWYVHGQS